MKKSIIISLIFLTIMACKNDNSMKTPTRVLEEDNSIEHNQKEVLNIGCYEYDNIGNTIKMEITEVSEYVKGNLSISYTEKDDSQGAFVGKLNGNKLIGTYTFNSEGTESSRDIAFLVKNNQLIEGYGDLMENGTKFKDTSSIKYISMMPLDKVFCD